MLTFTFTDGRVDQAPTLTDFIGRHFGQDVTVTAEWIGRHGSVDADATLLLMPDNKRAMWIMLAHIEGPDGAIGPEQATAISEGRAPNPFANEVPQPTLAERAAALNTRRAPELGAHAFVIPGKPAHVEGPALHVTSELPPQRPTLAQRLASLTKPATAGDWQSPAVDAHPRQLGPQL